MLIQESPLGRPPGTKGKKSEQERQRLYNVGKQTSWNQLNLVTKQMNEELNKENNINT